MSRSIDLLSYELSNYELQGADYLLTIKTKNIDLLDNRNIKELYELGYQITKKKIKEIKSKMEET